MHHGYWYGARIIAHFNWLSGGTNGNNVIPIINRLYCSIPYIKPTTLLEPIERHIIRKLTIARSKFPFSSRVVKTQTCEDEV